MKLFVARRLKAFDLGSSAILISSLMFGCSSSDMHHPSLYFFGGLVVLTTVFRAWLLWTFRVSAAKDPEILELLRDA